LIHILPEKLVKSDIQTISLHTSNPYTLLDPKLHNILLGDHLIFVFRPIKSCISTLVNKGLGYTSKLLLKILVLLIIWSLNLKHSRKVFLRAQFANKLFNSELQIPTRLTDSVFDNFTPVVDPEMLGLRNGFLVTTFAIITASLGDRVGIVIVIFRSLFDVMFLDNTGRGLDAQLLVLLVKRRILESFVFVVFGILILGVIIINVTHGK